MTADTSLTPSLDRLSRFKLRRLLTDAAKNVSFYHNLFEKHRIAPDDLITPDILQRLPITSKSDLLAAGTEQLVNTRFDQEILIRESTSGSTGQPFSIYTEPRYRRRRNSRFLRALMSCGYRPGHRLMLLSDRYPQSRRLAGNRRFVSVEQSTENILQEYLSFQPTVLYGFMTPLRLLAERVANVQSPTFSPRLVISTAEMFDSATRRTLETVFQCPVCDFYGMTEMGLVAWQGPSTDAYILSNRSILTEFVPHDLQNGHYRLIMTNLDLHASPIIRYDSGDLVEIDAAGKIPLVRSFIGRQIDTIVDDDGVEVSPYRITDALGRVDGLKRFKVVQNRPGAATVYAEVNESNKHRVKQEIRDAFGKLFRRTVIATIEFEANMISEGTTKFRPIESRVSRQ